jgi:hypothetical protein
MTNKHKSTAMAGPKDTWKADEASILMEEEPQFVAKRFNSGLPGNQERKEILRKNLATMRCMNLLDMP